MEQKNNTDTQPEKKSSGLAPLRKLFITLLLLVIAWSALRYIALPMFAGNLSAEPGEIAELKGRIDALENALAEIKSQPPVTAAGIDLAPLEARIAQLESMPAPNIEGPSFDSNELETEVAALKATVDELKLQDHSYVRSVILFTQLQQAVTSGKPYHDAFSALETLRPQLGEALNPLREAATIGVPTLEQLQSQLKKAIPSALSPKDENSPLMNNLRSLVKVRKVGEDQQGDDDGAILARAEAKLKQGDVLASLKEAEQLSPAAQTTLEVWMIHAKQHLDAKEALRAINMTLSQGMHP